MYLCIYEYIKWYPSLYAYVIYVYMYVNRFWYANLTASDMAPKCTGKCGALATSPMCIYMCMYECMYVQYVCMYVQYVCMYVRTSLSIEQRAREIQSLFDVHADWCTLQSSVS